MLAKQSLRRFDGLSSYLLACMLVIIVAGCGGGPSGDIEEAATNSANRTSEIIARTGPILAVRVGETAYLSDNNSFTTLSDPLTYHWSLLSKPDTSNAVLYNTTTTNPSLVTDVRGDYRAQLVVRAGGVSSQRAIQLVVATIPPEPVTGTHFHQGLSSSCVSCHNDEFVTIGSKAGNHIASGNKCETCHTPLGFNIVPFVDHQEVSGNCSTCHNGQVAIGKSDFHLPTNAECDSCHNTTSFFALAADGSFDHTGISGGCSACHNGNAAVGKTPTLADTPPGNHPITTAECISCHTTASFQGAFPDHSDPAIIGPGCNTCHGASSADNISDPPAGHPAMTRIDMTTIDCGYCHGIATFSLAGVFNHGLVDSTVITCETCHNDSNSINALGKGSAVPAHPATTEDCAFCHATTSFAIPVPDHSIPPVIGNRCDFCHGPTASGKPVDEFGPPPGNLLINAHLPTTITNPGILTPPNDRDCADCHNPGTFMSGTFDHDLSFYSPTPACEDCHNNVITLGKLNDHIPTSQDCGVCHLNTTDFAGATVDHASLSATEQNNCASCHNGTIATGQQVSTHLPTTQNCFSCHNYPNTDLSFKDASNFFHNGINGNCESCHSGNSNYAVVGAIGKKTNHIPALSQCVVCHDASTTSPGNFSPSAHFWNDVHLAITDGCEGCHVSFFLPLPSDPGANLVKDVNHVPTAQDCDVCHNGSAFTPTTMLAHEGITGNCVSCHDGSFTAAGTVGARAKTSTPNDIPPGTHPVTTADCVSCHNTTDFANASVDHNAPAVLAARCDSCHDGFQPPARGKIDKPNHVSTTEDCGVCHIAGGNFKPAVFDHTNIIDNCVSCHDGAIATGTAAKTNPPHIPIGAQDCSVCHLPTSFAQATFNHQNITNNCVSCHNGTTATGKDNDHVPTNGDCLDCHQTTGFKPATFDHAGIVDNCSSCHAAGFARPKNPGHVATSQDCGVCHNTTAFAPATFDHTGISSGCESCHDGNPITGKIDAVPAHITTGLDCYFCHSTATFAGGTWTHDASSANNCDTCHDGSTATGKIDAVPTHLSTTEQCDVCHTTNGWAPTVFSHDTNGNYPGNHRRDPGCNGCHGNTISSIIPWPSSQYAPFCAACHAGDFDRKGDHIGGENGTVAQNKDCSGGGRGCHKVSDRNFD